MSFDLAQKYYFIHNPEKYFQYGFNIIRIIARSASYDLVTDNIINLWLQDADLTK